MRFDKRQILVYLLTTACFVLIAILITLLLERRNQTPPYATEDSVVPFDRGDFSQGGSVHDNDNALYRYIQHLQRQQEELEERVDQLDEKPGSYDDNPYETSLSHEDLLEKASKESYAYSQQLEAALDSSSRDSQTSFDYQNAIENAIADAGIFGASVLDTKCSPELCKSTFILTPEQNRDNLTGKIPRLLPEETGAGFIYLPLDEYNKCYVYYARQGEKLPRNHALSAPSK